MNLFQADTPAPDATVLVVDDVADNLIAMRALLERPGVRVLCAATGAGALELLLQHDVALALLDVQMPEMDGYALAELMRGTERTRSVPIIFVTATPREVARVFRGYEAGAVDYLNKPFEPRLLEGKVAIFVELYQRRRALDQRNAELQHALDLNEIMTAVLTHDLRTPLAAISVSAELLRLASSDARVLKAAQHIRSSSARMARMIAQLLDFSHVRSGALQLQLRPADLQTVCESVVDELATGHAGARIEVRSSGDLQGVFDDDRMMQVFSNLLGNALQHGMSGDAAVEVRLDGSAAGSLRAEVLNPGQLPQDVLAEPFVPFRGRRQAADGGIGLGLYIVDQFVRAHGGQVRASSEGGRARFEFWIPRRAAPCASLAAGDAAWSPDK